MANSNKMATLRASVLLAPIPCAERVLLLIGGGHLIIISPQFRRMMSCSTHNEMTLTADRIKLIHLNSSSNILTHSSSIINSRGHHMVMAMVIPKEINHSNTINIHTHSKNRLIPGQGLAAMATIMTATTMTTQTIDVVKATMAP